MVLTEQKRNYLERSQHKRRCHFSFGLRPTWSFETLDGSNTKTQNQQ